MLGELEGITRAIALAQEMDLQRLQLLSDAKDLVDAIQSNSFDQKPQLVEGIDYNLRILSKFRSWNLLYVSRETNFITLGTLA